MLTRDRYEYHIVFSNGNFQLAEVTVYGNKRYQEAVAMDTLDNMPEDVRENCTHVSVCSRKVDG